MVDGIIEIVDDGRYLSLYRGFLVIADKERELGRVPLADISAVVLSANQACISKNVVVALGEQNSSIIFCGRNYLPTSMTLPYSGNYESACRMRSQIDAPRPLCKQIWKKLIQKKIANQAKVLEWRGKSKSARQVNELVRRVKSGDPDNLEGLAARFYWKDVMRPGFSRDRFGDDENVFLNYGYTVLRSAVARAVVAAGLLPAVGVHHRSRLNPFALVDDLMEPYRPLVDSLVVELAESARELSPEVKRRLASVLRLAMQTGAGVSPLYELLHVLARSLVKSYEDKVVRLKFGEMILP